MANSLDVYLVCCTCVSSLICMSNMQNLLFLSSLYLYFIIHVFLCRHLGCIMKSRKYTLVAFFDNQIMRIDCIFHDVGKSNANLFFYNFHLLPRSCHAILTAPLMVGRKWNLCVLDLSSWKLLDSGNTVDGSEFPSTDVLRKRKDFWLNNIFDIWI